TTVVPSLLLSSWPTTRARMSVVPPGANGTTMVIVFDGKLWATARVAARQLRLPTKNCRFVSFIGSSQAAYCLRRCDARLRRFFDLRIHAENPLGHERIELCARKVELGRDLSAVLPGARNVEAKSEAPAVKLHRQRRRIGLAAVGERDLEHCVGRVEMRI